MRAGLTHDALIARLDEYVPEVMRATSTPGLTVAVAIGGHTAWSRGFGLADLASGTPATPQTVTRAASLSKLYVVTAILQLVERGCLDLEAPVAPYMPELALRNPLGDREVTVYDLLTFRSGLRTDTPDVDGAPPRDLGDYLATELERNRRREYHGVDSANCPIRRWVSPVGEAYNYSNFGVAVLGHLVARANPWNLPFPDYVRERITKPLGMAHTLLPHIQTGPEVPPDLQRRIMTGYARFGRHLVESPRLHLQASPTGNLLTTPEDHLRWMLAIMNGGEYEGVRILEPQSVALMLQRHVTARREGITVHTGLIIEMANLGTESFYYGELGAYPWGWWSEARAYPELGLAIVACVNKWDMMRWFNPPAESPLGLIADYIAGELGREPRAATPQSRSWGWRLAYLAGVLLAERTYGLLGVSGDADTLLRLWHGALAGGATLDPPWDQAGYEAGVRDALASEMTPAAVERLISGDALAVRATEIPALALELGGKPGVPFPMPYYAQPR
jgi:CubicO group peptidase (beta-lactamase class C family)